MVDLCSLELLVEVGRWLSSGTSLFAVQLRASGSKISLTDNRVVGHIWVHDGRLAHFSVEIQVFLRRVVHQLDFTSLMGWMLRG